MTVAKKHPDEIMSLVDQMQPLVGEDFDLSELVWDVISDVLDSVDLAVRCHADPTYPSGTENPNIEITDTVRDYVGNHYGDL